MEEAGGAATVGFDPSYEWGGGKWKESDLSSLEDLMNEHSSLPPQIAEWFWCIQIRQGLPLHTRFDEHGLSFH